MFDSYRVLPTAEGCEDYCITAEDRAAYARADVWDVVFYEKGREVHRLRHYFGRANAEEKGAAYMKWHNGRQSRVDTGEPFPRRSAWVGDDGFTLYVYNEATRDFDSYEYCEPSNLMAWAHARRLVLEDYV